MNKPCTKCKISEKEVGSYCRPCFNLKMRQYYRANKEKRLNQKREYYNKNKATLREKKKEYHQRRMKVDKVYAIKIRLRDLVGTTIRNCGYTKSSRTAEIIGISHEEIIVHLEATFLNRYGYTTDWKDVHIDHIIPISTATSEEEAIKLNHYTNLQLLTAKDNRRKSNSLQWT